MKFVCPPVKETRGVAIEITWDFDRDIDNYLRVDHDLHLNMVRLSKDEYFRTRTFIYEFMSFSMARGI